MYLAHELGCPDGPVLNSDVWAFIYSVFTGYSVLEAAGPNRP